MHTFQQSLMRPASIFLLFTLLFLSSCKKDIGPVARAVEVDATSAACREIARKISANIQVEGTSIQIIEENFTQQHSNIALPYSKVLRDGMTREMSRLGAHITAQETGTEPFVLLGTYAKVGKMVIIDVSLRQYGDLASQDIAIAEAAIPTKALDPHWLTPSFSTTADSLIDQLSKGYMGSSFNLIIEPARSGVPGEPSLLLGRKFSAELHKAADRAQSLPISLTSGNNVSLQTSYSLTAQTIQFTSWLEGSPGKKVATATAVLPMQLVPKELLQPMAAAPMTVCTRYEQKGPDVQPASSFEAQLLGEKVVAALRDIGITPEPCTNQNKKLAQVVSSVTLPPVRSTRDGYQLSTAIVEVQVFAESGAPAGSYRNQATRPFKDNRKTATEKCIEKATGKALLQSLAEMLL